MYSYSYFYAGALTATLTEVFAWFFLSCKPNARVKLAKTGHGPHSSQINCVVLCIIFYRLCSTTYFLWVTVYCNTATGCQTKLQLNKWINKIYNGVAQICEHIY